MILTASHGTKSMHPRRNPGLTVSSTATYSPSSSGFLSPRFPPSHRPLLGHSPPPSPGLPSLLPKHGKKVVTGHMRLLTKILFFLSGALILSWIGLRLLFGNDVHSPPGQAWQNGEEYEMVGDSLLPKEPSAVVVTDKKGKLKWTVSIPSAYKFPLRPVQYHEICSQAMEVSEQLASSSRSLSKRHRAFYQPDPYYMDVQEAEEQNLLPQSKPNMMLPIGGEMNGLGLESGGFAVCEKSLTYVMETSDAGLGKTLLALWTSYGLAQKEGRAFFIDDTRWPYGNFSSYFQPPPQPSCLPPPTSHIVPCPHNARHIVVSAATTSHTFGHEFNEEYEDPFKMEVQRQHKIFALARAGYEALFKLRDDDAKYVIERVKSLYGPTTEARGISVGFHVRRGDLHPFEFQYSEDYIPLTRFLDVASNIIKYRLNNSSAIKSKKSSLNARADASSSSSTILNSDSPEALLSSTHSLIALASDDPDIYTASEFLPPITSRAQARIALASKTALEAAANGQNKNKYIDEISGWEGGFFRDVFWSLGHPSSSAKSLESLKPKNSDVASVGKVEDDAVPQGAMQLRELVGRSYLLDLAVLAGADSVICTLSATGCRLLGVMKGWDAVGGSDMGYGWKNIDGDFDWRGIEW